MSKEISIFWFRQDLRLADNPGLSYAANKGDILPIFIFDDHNAGDYVKTGASKWWLYHSLLSLQKSLAGNLSLYKGDPLLILKKLCKDYDIKGVYWNRCYEPWRIKRDTKIKEKLSKENIDVQTFNGSLLWEPWEIKKNDGTAYKVFTPFYRKGCLMAKEPRQPITKPKNISSIFDKASLDIAELNLLPEIRWDKKFANYWDIGEDGAKKNFDKFIKNGIINYKEGRNFPAKPYVSRMSPYLHFGEISPNYLWFKAQSVGDDKNIDHFCSELGWREFSYSLLYFNPELPKKNLQTKFDHFSWNNDDKLLSAWQRGNTGVPMVDAGMRELWQTGYMHNRVRMIVGSFLVKNLRLHWQHGERWFWDSLVDADLANNSASWQWVAGCGADAAPYFRIFNPVMQGQKFDPEGEYVRKYVPEIAKLPNKYLFNPWEAPKDLLQQAGIILGKDYPNPIIDLKKSRDDALYAFQLLKQI